MEEELKGLSEKTIEEAIAKTFGELVGSGCKCKILSRTYSNPEKTIFKIEIKQKTYEDSNIAIEIVRPEIPEEDK